ncbi:MAG: hypothetical protein AVDCRST_MAG77-1620, partial [uncultured Chloroflexi bacterium]
AGRSLSHADPPLHARRRLPGRDEPGAAAPVVDAGERAAARVARGAVPRLERVRLARPGGAPGVGGPGAGRLDERGVAAPLGGARPRGGPLAAARARRLSPGAGRSHRLLAAPAARVPNHALPQPGREGAPRDPARPHRGRRPCRVATPGAATRLRPGGPRRLVAGRPRPADGAGGGGAVRARRGAGAGRRLRRGAAAGGGGHPLRGAGREERDLSPRHPPALPWHGPAPHARGRGAPPAAHLQGTARPRHPARPRRDLARGRPPAARRGLDRVGPARCRGHAPQRQGGRRPRSALPRAAVAGHAPAPAAARRARLLPRPLAGGTAPAGGQANARGGPAVRPRAPDLPTPPRARSPRRGRALLRGRHHARHPDRLLGPPAPAHPRPAPAPPGAHPFSARLPLAGTDSRKSVGHGPPAHGRLGATPTPGGHATHPARPRPSRDPCRGRL